MSINSQTLLIHVESGDYPVRVPQLAARHPNVSFGTVQTEESLRALGYEVVKTTDRPDGDVVSEAVPLKTEEGYVQVWDVRAYNEQERNNDMASRKASRMSRIKDAVAATLAIGARIDFGGEHGVQHIQMRDGDRANVLGLKADAEAMIERAQGEQCYLRTYENNLIIVAPEFMVESAWIVLRQFKQVMAAAWALEDQVKHATTLQELPLIPANLLASIDPVNLRDAVEQAMANKASKASLA